MSPNDHAMDVAEHSQNSNNSMQRTIDLVVSNWQKAARKARLSGGTPRHGALTKLAAASMFAVLTFPPADLFIIELMSAADAGEYFNPPQPREEFRDSLDKLFDIARDYALVDPPHISSGRFCTKLLPGPENEPVSFRSFDVRIGPMRDISAIASMCLYQIRLLEFAGDPETKRFEHIWAKHREREQREFATDAGVDLDQFTFYDQILNCDSLSKEISTIAGELARGLPFSDERTERLWVLFEKRKSVANEVSELWKTKIPEENMDELLNLISLLSRVQGRITSAPRPLHPEENVWNPARNEFQPWVWSELKEIAQRDKREKESWRNSTRKLIEEIYQDVNLALIESAPFCDRKIDGLVRAIERDWKLFNTQYNDLMGSANRTGIVPNELIRKLTTVRSNLDGNLRNVIEKAADACGRIQTRALEFEEAERKKQAEITTRPNLIDLSSSNQTTHLKESEGMTGEGASEEVQKLIGGFEILSKVGSGGVGVLYKARGRIEQVVCLKILKTVDPASVKRFRREASLTRGLSNPNVVKSYDLFVEGEETYFIQEFVDGIDLKKLVEQRGTLSLEESLSIAGQICDGLKAAHRLSIVHRDIKPANIMIDVNNVVKITDFGLVTQLTGGADDQTLSDVTVTNMSPGGTPHYMAPEQWDPNQSENTSTDIYSLGVLFHFMLTAKYPFKGNNMYELMNSHTTGSPIPVRDHRPEVPESLEKLILSMLAKNPDSRPSVNRVSNSIDSISNELELGNTKLLTASQFHRFADESGDPNARISRIIEEIRSLQALEETRVEELVSENLLEQAIVSLQAHLKQPKNQGEEPTD